MKKQILFAVLSLLLLSCQQETKPDTPATTLAEQVKDTTITAYQNELNKSYEVGLYSKSFTYYWLTGKDTLDFRINSTQHENDSSVNLSILHKEPVLFTTALERIKACLPLIEKNLDLTKLSSLYFRSPIYYLDLASSLSSEYEQKFGRKNISYQQLNQFLLGTGINKQLNEFLRPLDKNVASYGVEKFHLITKQGYQLNLPATDFTAYPDFTIDGIGFYVRLAAQ